MCAWTYYLSTKTRKQYNTVAGYSLWLPNQWRCQKPGAADRPPKHTQLLSVAPFPLHVWKFFRHDCCHPHGKYHRLINKVGFHHSVWLGITTLQHRKGEDLLVENIAQIASTAAASGVYSHYIGWTVPGHILSPSVPTHEYFPHSIPVVSWGDSMIIHLHYTPLTKVHADRWEEVGPQANN